MAYHTLTNCSCSFPRHLEDVLIYSTQLWWPLPRSMQNTQHPHPVTNRIVDQQIVMMCHQFSSAWYSTRSPKTRVVSKSGCHFRKLFIQHQSGAWIVGLYVFIDQPAIRQRFQRPIQIHDPLSTLRRVSERRAANSASTSAADTK